MKKTLKILICLILLFSINSPSFITKKVSASEDGYLPILQEAIQQYGYYSYEKGSGIVYAKLADFDNNSSNELLLVLLNYDNEYEVKIFSGNNIVYENRLEGPGNGTYMDNSFDVAVDNNGAYLKVASGFNRAEQFSMASSYFGNKIIQFTNGNTVNETIFSEELHTYDLYVLEVNQGEPGFNEEMQGLLNNWDYNEEFMDVEKFSINGSAVSAEDYRSKFAEYDGLNWENIILGNAGSNSVEVDSELVVNDVINQLYAASTPKNLGENIKASLPKAEFESLREWLSYSEYFKQRYSIDEVYSDNKLLHFIQDYTGGYNLFIPEAKFENGEADMFPANTFTRLPVQDVDNFLSVYLGQKLPTEDFTVAENEEFPYVKKDGFYYFPDMSYGYFGDTVHYIDGVYQLTEDIYYIRFDEYEIYPDDNGGNFDEYKKQVLDNEEMIKSLDMSARGYAVMKKTIIDDRYQWTLIERNTEGKTFDESIIEEFKKYELPKAQIKFELKKIESVASIDDLNELITDLTKDKTLNDRDISILGSYITASLQKINQSSIEAKKNKVTLSKDTRISPEFINQNNIAVEKLLNDNTIELSKAIKRISRYNVNGLNTSKSLFINFERSMFEGSDDISANDYTYVSFDGSQMGVLLRNKDLKALFEQKESFQIEYFVEKSEVTIKFKLDNKETQSLPLGIQVLSPSDSKNAVVYLNDTIWGGQYYERNESILFETKVSGTFETKESTGGIDDISQFTDEQQKSMQYLANRGILEVENGQFFPNHTINRNDFAKALVRMFFALDNEATTTFTDVDTKSKYYAYIASGEQNDIIKGFDDGTFKGETLISVEDVISFAGRTLSSNEGYNYPEEPVDFLQFIDQVKIAEYAKKEVALAVREGLIEQGGLLGPQRQITKQEASDILYKLYGLLYEEPAILLQEEVEASKSSRTLLMGGVIGAVAIVIGLGFLFIRRKKNLTSMQE